MADQPFLPLLRVELCANRASEIANVPMNQQAKLLRMIETGEFERVGSSKTSHANVRIVSATNANPHEEVAAEVGAGAVVIKKFLGEN